MGECNICIEQCNILLHCSFCDFGACKKCLSRFLLESINEASCMNCKKNYDREYLIKVFGLYWFDNKYKPSRKQILFDRQKALFTETVQYVEIAKEMDNISKQIVKLNESVKTVFNNFRKNHCSMLDYLDTVQSKDPKIVKNFKKQEKEYKKELKTLHSQIFTCRKLKKQYENQYNTGIIEEIVQNNNNVKPKNKKATFYGKCFDEKCPGLMNETGICITCEKKSCTKCFEKLTDNHECNPDTLETIKMLKEDTKPCPKCFVPIHRLAGCYQMWCTNCHTTFHYNTGEILNEKIHNPHYVEWMQKQNINTDGGNCNLDNRVYSFQHKSKKHSKSASNILRAIYHIELTIIRYHVDRKIQKYSNTQNSDRILRCQYLTGKTTENRFKQQLFMNHKQAMRWNDVKNLFQFLADAMKSILEEYLVKSSLTRVRTQIENLFSYFTTERIRLHNIYQNDIPPVYMNVDTLGVVYITFY